MPVSVGISTCLDARKINTPESATISDAASFENMLAMSSARCRDSNPCGQRVHWQRQQRPDRRMTIVKVTADVDEIIRKKIVARLLLERLWDEFIQNHIAIAQDADRNESRRVGVVRRDLSEIDVVNQQKANEEKRL